MAFVPAGGVQPGRNGVSSADYDHGYQGQFTEHDEETGWDAFELRMYDGRMARWMSDDPYRQYHSPYLAMGNNPVSGVDPDGGLFGISIMKTVKSSYHTVKFLEKVTTYTRQFTMFGKILNGGAKIGIGINSALNQQETFTDWIKVNDETDGFKYAGDTWERTFNMSPGGRINFDLLDNGDVVEIIDPNDNLLIEYVPNWNRDGHAVRGSNDNYLDWDLFLERNAESFSGNQIKIRVIAGNNNPTAFKYQYNNFVVPNGPPTVNSPSRTIRKYKTVKWL